MSKDLTVSLWLLLWRQLGTHHLLAKPGGLNLVSEEPCVLRSPNWGWVCHEMQLYLWLCLEDSGSGPRAPGSVGDTAWLGRDPQGGSATCSW